MPPPRGLIQWVDRELHRSSLLPREARLLVAVSGGADSVGLLRILCAVNRSRFWGWTLLVGHVDHGIRGSASAADAKFVRALAKELGLKYMLRRLQLKKNSSEALARDRRLSALRAMVRSEKCSGVVMGHHADDQAETVLLRIMRGCGLDGLAGMRSQNQVNKLTIYRPLLSLPARGDSRLPDRDRSTLVRRSNQRIRRLPQKPRAQGRAPRARKIGAPRGRSGWANRDVSRRSGNGHRSSIARNAQGLRSYRVRRKKLFCSELFCDPPMLSCVARSCENRLPSSEAPAKVLTSKECARRFESCKGTAAEKRCN